MTIDSHTALAILRPLDAQLEVKSAAITLDEAWSPYARATIVCAMPAAEIREAFDLRDTDFYLDLRLRQDFGKPLSLADLTADFSGSISAMTAFLDGDPISKVTNRYHVPWNGASVRAARKRNMSLLVVDRRFDDKTKELTITAASLEALLLGDALVAGAPSDPGTTSLRAIAQWVLDRYGLTLEADSEDATVAESSATIWQPGVNAWRYLDSMLEAASLRLWVDETGLARITVRQSLVPGAITITPTGTMTGLADSMTRNPEVWFDAVVVEYRWVDEFDLNQVAYDFAGAEPAKSTLLIEKSLTRYPGPGAAAGLLARAQGRGRVLDTEAVSDYSVSPGMAATITPPDTEAQTGYVSAVTWRYPAAEMTLASRGLVDTPETAYLFGPPGVSYLDVPPGVDYLEFDWSMV